MLDNGTLGLVYKEIQDCIKKGSKLSIVSAYFSINSYDKLKKDLNKIDNMRFIFTKPSFTTDTDKEAREYYIDNNDIFGGDFEIKLKNEMTQSSISRECSDWIREKTEIKSFKIPNEAQPRLICIDNNDDTSVNISGADFTPAGLGIVKSNRKDIIQCTYGEALTKSSLELFNYYWSNNEDLEDVKDKVLEQMQTMYKENPAEFIYFLSLYNIFSNKLNEIDEDNIIRKGNTLKETNIWNKLYQFQKDAVIGVIEKIENNNGCILADSVGLGKTYTALAVIKYYESRNDRVLVLSPKKLRENWSIYNSNDKRNVIDENFHFDLLNHTDLSREKGYSGGINLKNLNWGNYDLVVIDESHNFRNNPAIKDHKTRYEKLLEDIIKSGHKTRVLMLSATPVNNKMNDIKNQIAFITADNDNALEEDGIKSIEYTLKKAQAVFNQWSKESDNTEDFIDKVDLDYFQLLDTLTIARSRKHIEKYYGLDEIGKFPERLKALTIKSEIDTKKEFPPLKDINIQIGRLNLGLYTPLNYVYPNKITSYEAKYDKSVGHGGVFKQSDRDNNNIGLIRVNLLNRMKSSIHSFQLSIERLLYNINQHLDKINNKNYEYDSDLDINLIDPEEDEYDDLMLGKNVKVLMQDMDLVKMKQDLELDKEKLEQLLINTKEVIAKRDQKLQDLKEIIKNKIENPINPENKKVIIFSAFADTAKYLYKHLHSWIQDEFNLNTALITGSGGNKTTLKNVTLNDIDEILRNFSPISKEREKIEPEAKEEIDILICTDCISEGQNLQDCDYLINYDIHWNPVRIIQRFGRIDRIGSINDKIQLVNFWPNMELDEYIDLETRVKTRMVMVDVSATGEENIISDNQKMNDLNYRKDQLEQLQKGNVLNLEDLNNSISLTDLTFSDYKRELSEYLKTNKKELENSPKGLHSIIKIPEDLRGEIEPGVIFLLKQITETTEKQEKNPLNPYYLVYVGEDNEIKFTYIKSKKVLDYYKKLCKNNNSISIDLVKEFNNETNNGKEMKKYSKLLIETINSIINKKEEVGVESLFSKGGTSVIENDINALEDFELITFLIIK